MSKLNAQKIGILGAGQLARMMVIAGHENGYDVAVMGSKKLDPALQVTSQSFVGDLSSKKDLKKFLQKVDVATFESEFMDADLLNHISKKTQTRIFPSPKLMGLIQDRWSQKKLLTKSNIPTSEFIKVSSEDDLELAKVCFPDGFVLKKRRFGYDGYGTFVFKSNQDMKNTLKSLKINHVSEGFIAEKFVPFNRELAFIIARNRSGQMSVFPTVQSFQKDSRCFWVKGPIQSSKVERQIKNFAKFIHEINYVGVMAFELFETNTEILVNELAPRVHNSGHYTQNALVMDQFTTHLRCLLDLPLPTSPPLAKGFAMVNLLGQSTKNPKGVWPAQTFVHWYGKQENRPGRKMGHINTLAHNPDVALRYALKVEREFQL